MAPKLTFYTSLSAETKWANDRWVATFNDLPLYGYGETAEEASSRLAGANALIDSLMIIGGRGAVDDFMQRAGIRFELSESAPSDHEPVSFSLPVVHTLESP
jgi:hypothetical protein